MTPLSHARGEEWIPSASLYKATSASVAIDSLDAVGRHCLLRRENTRGGQRTRIGKQRQRLVSPPSGGQLEHLLKGGVPLRFGGRIVLKDVERFQAEFEWIPGIHQIKSFRICYLLTTNNHMSRSDDEEMKASLERGPSCHD